jgi:hypothetical protein
MYGPCPSPYLYEEAAVELQRHIERFFEKYPELDDQSSRWIVSAVNQEIDQFAHFPNMKFLRKHRKFLHHREGIEYFGLRYGRVGALAAVEHVKDDCDGYVPRAKDYYDRTVDEYGCLNYWARQVSDSEVVQE